MKRTDSLQVPSNSPIQPTSPDSFRSSIFISQGHSAVSSCNSSPQQPLSSRFNSTTLFPTSFKQPRRTLTENARSLPNKSMDHTFNKISMNRHTIHSHIGSVAYNRSPLFQNVWIAILFSIFFVGYVVHIGYALIKLDKVLPNHGNSRASAELDWPDVEKSVLWVGGFFFGIITSLINAYCLQKIPRVVMYSNFFFATLTIMVFAAIAFLVGNIGAGVSWSFFVFCYLWALLAWGPRMNFSKKILQHVMYTLYAYPSILLVAFIGILLQTINVVCGIMAIGSTVLSMFDPVPELGTSSDLICSMVYLVIGFYWTTQVIRYTIHSIIASLFVQLYFLSHYKPAKITSQEPSMSRTSSINNLSGNTFASLSSINQSPKSSPSITLARKISPPFDFVSSKRFSPPNPVKVAAVRALSASFGSICLGSMLIPLMEFLRSILTAGLVDSQLRVDYKEKERQQKLPSIFRVFHIALRMYANLVDRWNHYALTTMMIYGTPFYEAAIRTQSIVQERKIADTIRNMIIGNVLGLNAVLLGLIGAVFGVSVVLFSAWLGNTVTNLVVAALAGFILMFFQYSIVSEAIYAGVSSTVICFALDEDAIKTANHGLYLRFKKELGEHVHEFIV